MLCAVVVLVGTSIRGTPVLAETSANTARPTKGEVAAARSTPQVEDVEIRFQLGEPVEVPAGGVFLAGLKYSARVGDEVNVFVPEFTTTFDGTVGQVGLGHFVVTQRCLIDGVAWGAMNSSNLAQTSQRNQTLAVEVKRDGELVARGETTAVTTPSEVMIAAISNLAGPSEASDVLGGTMRVARVSPRTLDFGVEPLLAYGALAVDRAQLVGLTDSMTGSLMAYLAAGGTIYTDMTREAASDAGLGWLVADDFGRVFFSQDLVGYSLLPVAQAPLAGSLGAGAGYFDTDDLKRTAGLGVTRLSWLGIFLGAYFLALTVLFGFALFRRGLALKMVAAVAAVSLAACGFVVVASRSGRAPRAGELAVRLVKGGDASGGGVDFVTGVVQIAGSSNKRVTLDGNLASVPAWDLVAGEPVETVVSDSASFVVPAHQGGATSFTAAEVASGQELSVQAEAIDDDRLRVEVFNRSDRPVEGVTVLAGSNAVAIGALDAGGSWRDEVSLAREAPLNSASLVAKIVSTWSDIGVKIGGGPFGYGYEVSNDSPFVESVWSLVSRELQASLGSGRVLVLGWAHDLVPIKVGADEIDARRSSLLLAAAPITASPGEPSTTAATLTTVLPQRLAIEARPPAGVALSDSTTLIAPWVPGGITVFDGKDFVPLLDREGQPIPQDRNDPRWGAWSPAPLGASQTVNPPSPEEGGFGVSDIPPGNERAMLVGLYEYRLPPGAVVNNLVYLRNPGAIGWFEARFVQLGHL